MRYLVLCCLAGVLLSCQKADERDEEKPGSVSIYLLKSFNVNTDLSVNPAILQIINPVLEDEPLVANAEIIYYRKSTRTFKLNRDIGDVFRNLTTGGFAVVVNGKPLYYGRFHPGYLSSMYFGMAMIDPLFVNKEIPVSFPMITASAQLELLDKRNDPELLNALRLSGRLW